MAIQLLKKTAARFAQYGFERTDGSDGAIVGRFVEALRDIEVRFGQAYHFTDGDLRSWAGQAHAAMFAAYRLNQAVIRQIVHHLDQMVARDSVESGNFTDCSQFLRLLQAEVNEHAQ